MSSPGRLHTTPPRQNAIGLICLECAFLTENASSYTVNKYFAYQFVALPNWNPQMLVNLYDVSFPTKQVLTKSLTHFFNEIMALKNNKYQGNDSFCYVTPNYFKHLSLFTQAYGTYNLMARKTTTKHKHSFPRKKTWTVESLLYGHCHP